MRKFFKLASICTFVICDGAAGQSVQFTKTTAVTNSSAVLWTFLKCAPPPRPRAKSVCISQSGFIIAHITGKGRSYFNARGSAMCIVTACGA